MSRIRKLDSIAIVGGGFAGLACAVKASTICPQIHIYDPAPVGNADASAAAAGILHPMTPSGAVLWNGLEGYSSSLELMDKVSKFSKRIVYSNSTKLIRPIMSEKEKIKWIASVDRRPELLKLLPIETMCKLIEEDRLNDSVSAVIEFQKAVVVNPEQYLQALWETVYACSTESIWNEKYVDDVTSLSKQYSAVIVAAGAGSLRLWRDEKFPLSQLSRVKLVRGQNLQFKLRVSDHQIEENYGYLKGEYIVPSISPDSLKEIDEGVGTWIGGSTHQHIDKNKYNFNSNHPITHDSQKDLMRKLRSLWPHLQNVEPISSKGGVRVVNVRSHYGRLPILCRHPNPNLNNVWLISGLGSRGLVYHSLLADYLIKAIERDNVDCIPHVLSPK